MCYEVTYKYGGVEKNVLTAQLSESSEKISLRDVFSEYMTVSHVALLTNVFANCGDVHLNGLLHNNPVFEWI